jgi:putative ABC transport system permease protein
VKPLTPLAVACRNLERKPFRSAMLIAIVALFAFTLFSGTVIGKSVSRGTRVMADRLGADILFVPYGYEKNIQGSLLRGEPSSFYLDGAFEKRLLDMEGVAQVTSQLFVASLRAPCCTLPVQIIGIDPKTDFVVRPWMGMVLARPMTDSEIVVGSRIVGGPGEKLSLFDREFTIAARLEATGMGFDTSVFMDIDRARRLLLASDLASRMNLPEGLDRSSFVSSTLVKAAAPDKARETADAILKRHALDYNLDFVMAAAMVSDISGRLAGFSHLFYGLSFLLWLLAVGVMAFVFSMALNERKKEFGVMRTLGASRVQLAGIILRESLLVSLAGAGFGLVLACAVLFPFETYISTRLRLPSLLPGNAALLATMGGTFLIAVLTGPLACMFSAIRLGRSEICLALREDC